MDWMSTSSFMRSEVLYLGHSQQNKTIKIAISKVFNVLVVSGFGNGFMVLTLCLQHVHALKAWFGE